MYKFFKDHHFLLDFLFADSIDRWPSNASSFQARDALDGISHKKSGSLYTSKPPDSNYRKESVMQLYYPISATATSLTLVPVGPVMISPSTSFSA